MSSQYCKPAGSDPVWRCPVCGQWWRLDLPNGSVLGADKHAQGVPALPPEMAGGTTAQEGIRMTRIRIMCDQTDGTTIKLGTIQSDETGDTLYSAHPSLTQDMYRGTITLALLRWIGHLEQFSQITNQQDKEDA